MQESVELRHGRLYRLSPGSVGVKGISDPSTDGQPLTVRLSVAPYEGDEFRTNLRVGERFQFGPTVWELREVRDPDTYDYVVLIAQV